MSASPRSFLEDTRRRWSINPILIIRLLRWSTLVADPGASGAAGTSETAGIAGTREITRIAGTREIARITIGSVED